MPAGNTVIFRIQNQFPKNKHFLPPDTYVCVSIGKKYLFFWKFSVLPFLKRPVLRFALLPYYNKYILKFSHKNSDTAEFWCIVGLTAYKEKNLLFLIFSFYCCLVLVVYKSVAYEKMGVFKIGNNY